MLIYLIGYMQCSVSHPVKAVGYKDSGTGNHAAQKKRKRNIYNHYMSFHSIHVLTKLSNPQIFIKMMNIFTIHFISFFTMVCLSCS